MVAVHATSCQVQTPYETVTVTRSAVTMNLLRLSSRGMRSTAAVSGTIHAFWLYSQDTFGVSNTDLVESQT